jgi:Holliday junction resolvase RusA-like endonuclease
MVKIKFTIPLPPISKKNSQQIFRPNGMNRPIIVPSKQYKDYEAAAMRYIPRIRGITPISNPVNIECRFYMPTKRKCDLTNLLEAIDDVMVKAGLLADDNYTVIQSHDGSRVFYDKENPRTEIFITEMKFS